MKRIIGAILTLALCMSWAGAAATQRFWDVPASHWACEEIAYAVDEGLFRGTGTTTFSPSATMTRAMLVEVLYRYAGTPAVTGTAAGATSFRDVPAGAYYHDAVVWAYGSGLLPGWFLYDSGQRPLTRFEPDRVTLRFEFALLLYRFSQKVMGDAHDAGAEQARFLSAVGGFTDMELGTVIRTAYPTRWVTQAGIQEVGVSMLGWARPQGILTGTGTATMSPGAGITRAQVAAMMARYHKLYAAGAADPLTQARDEMLRLVNGEREKAGLPPLKADAALHRAAQIRAGEIATLFSHTRPSGAKCFTALAEEGVSYRRAGENLLRGCADAPGALAAWMKSEGHRSNILSSQFTTMGVGYNAEKNCWVQFFIA